MITKDSKVKNRSGRVGVIVNLVDWVDGRPTGAIVRHTDDPIYKQEEIAYKLTTLTHAN